MGCCFSGEEEAKETELPLPENGKAINVYVKKQGMFDADYDVLDISGGEPGQIWMLVDTVGGIFSGGMKYYLKYRKAGEEESQVLGAAEIHGSDTEFKYKITDVDVDVDLEFDSDREDDWSDDGDSDNEFWMEKEVKKKIKAKWKLEKECNLYSDKEMTQKLGKLKVKTKGKYKRKTKTTTRMEEYTDEEGNEKTREVTETEVKHKCKLKKFYYKFEVMDTKINLDVSKTDGSSFWRSKLEWTAVSETGAELFKITGDGRNCRVQTGEGSDPASTLLAAFAVSCKFDPAEVQSSAESMCIHRVHD